MQDMRQFFRVLTILGGLTAASVLGLISGPGLAAEHPLDPLDGMEIATAVELVRNARNLPAETLYPYVALLEPEKQTVLGWTPGEDIARRAFVVAYSRDSDETAEAVVNLGTKTVESWTHKPGAQPNVMFADFEDYAKIVQQDPRWREAMTRRGLDPDTVWVDIWAPGVLSDAASKSGSRVFRGLSYATRGNTNMYAHPVEGVVAIVDGTRGIVTELIDTSPPVPMTTGNGDFDAAALPPARDGLKPLVISQPEGPSFDVNGHEVTWQDWSFRWALLPREGPVLYQVSFKGRSVLYRAAISEMLVPYGDPDPNWSFRSAFDAGEYGMGRMSGSLVPGADAPANAVLMDATLADDLGQGFSLEDAVAIYERDGGILWKHNDVINQRSESRRARELVITSVATIANYDYQLSWIFRQDGSLRFEAGLTGIMLAKGVKATEASQLSADHDGHYGHLVQPGISAIHHQHFFNFRLDFDVDGTANRVVEQDSNPVPPGPDNPLGNAFVMTETVIRTEAEARRDMNLQTARKWRVLSADKTNALGQPTGYALLPGENSVPYLHPSSAIRQRGRFVDHHLWITRHAEGEQFAAGNYPNQAPSSEGLPSWQEANRSLDGEDVVLWYTFGVTHIPRPEDWPVMPVHKAGFAIIPSGFFSRNPALDIR
jgi:primary-amine oxidase